jgi:hypothetical protein
MEEMAMANPVVLFLGGGQRISLGENGQHQLLSVCTQYDNVLLAWARVV